MTPGSIDLACAPGRPFYGVTGYPLLRTLSPAMHHAALRVHRMDAVYLPFPIDPAAFEARVRELVGAGLRGLSVTAPFKARAYAMADAVDATARGIGSVNTLRVDEGRLVGTSTDGSGLLRDLEHTGIDLAATKVLCLGGGGAARAVVAALAGAGAREVVVAARSPERAAWASACGARVVALDEVARSSAEALAGLGLIVQATPVGASPGDEIPLGWPAVPKAALVYDLLYEPETTFLRSAAVHGCPTRNGLGMLLYQGALAFTFWTGLPAPVEEMARAIGFDRG